MIYELDGLISDKTLCNKIIEYFESSNKRSTNQNQSSFKGRTLSLFDVEDCEIKKQISCLTYKITQISFSLYKKSIFPEFLDIVQWNPDMEMRPHTDNVGKTFNQRHYTSICYLNDNYNGGQTYLPEHNYFCTPKKGKVLIFPSNYPHGVSKIKNNTRYTLAMWFTVDEKFICNFF
jgi:hypothetical protein